MAYSATLANMRGILSDTDYKRILDLFSRAGLSMDHKQFDEELLDKGTKQILKTRDGKLRAAVPSPLGSCVFLNDVSMDEMFAALKKHKEIVNGYPRNGEGLDAFVDSSDTGYTMNNKPVEEMMNGTNGSMKKNSVMNDDTSNGHMNGVSNGAVKVATHHASAPEGVDGLQQNGSNINVYVNGNGANGAY
jgi:3-dehydroquinate synthase